MEARLGRVARCPRPPVGGALVMHYSSAARVARLPPRGLRAARRSGSAEPSQYCGSFANDGCGEAGGAASGGGGGAGAGGERSRMGARRGLVQGEGRACSIRLYVQGSSFPSIKSASTREHLAGAGEV